jgi:putative protein-disulfide isomerase
MNTIIYCYDAYCGWCYAFSPVIKKIFETYKNKFAFETLSGGIIPVESTHHISKMANYINEAYQRVEALSGIKFGEDYLWHIKNAGESDWYPNSEKAAIALCVFKDYHPNDTILFAADLQYSLHYEGRDLTDNEAYRHLLEKYNIPAAAFYTKLQSEAYKEKAYYEFALCKQLQVTGFPAVLMQVSHQKFYLLARGFTSYHSLQKRINDVLSEIENKATTP